jgi:hypothetical protein
VLLDKYLAVTMGAIASLPSVNKAIRNARNPSNLVRCRIVDIRPKYNKFKSTYEEYEMVLDKYRGEIKGKEVGQLNMLCSCSNFWRPGCPAIRIFAAGIP